MKRLDFPFSAIVGQEALKTALLIGVVDPSIGGVLLRGNKGTAKTTAVRALGSLIGKSDEMGRLVELPLNTTEDRLVGSLHIERALQEGKRAFQDGLLKEAHEGLLYVDEVNLLEDHLVDVLLDVAASGVNVVEREGISKSHNARFLLIGTMNPEEGELRPQFLDRFGLCVAISSVISKEERKEIVKGHLDWQRDGSKFIAKWAQDDELVLRTILNGRRRLTEVEVPEEVIDFSVQLAMESGASGHRAEVILVKAARALAALTDEDRVTKRAVLEVATLVLLHRVACSPVESDEARERLVQEAIARTDHGSEIGHAAVPANETPHWEQEWGVGHDEVETMQVPGNQAAGSTLITYLKKKRKKLS